MQQNNFDIRLLVKVADISLINKLIESVMNKWTYIPEMTTII